MTPSCRSDACRQGRAPCPTPDACRLPVPDENRTLEPGAAIALVLILLVSAALSAALIALMASELAALFSG